LRTTANTTIIISSETVTTTTRTSKGSQMQSASSISHYLDVVVVLAQKDFKVRYRNSVLGFLWSLLNPLAYMAILTLVFSLLLRVSIPNFAPWVLIGLLVWRFFSIGTAQGLGSIVANPSLVSKVYVPRYIIVLSNNIANFLGATLEFIVLFPLLAILGVNMTGYALFLAPVLVLEFLLVFGLSLSLSSLNLKYRDFYQLWDIALQLGFFLSPIVYDANLIPERFRFVYSLNPVTSLIQSTRSIFLLHQLPPTFDIGVIVSSVVILLLVGFLIFGRLEKRFAEEL
jgi:lipopolysaccharide transport system permease protein